MKSDKSISFSIVLSITMMLFFVSPDANTQTGNIPKNIFILISDGWGINHIRATNYWQGIDSTSYQKFPVHYFTSTYQGIQAPPADTPSIEGYRTEYNSTLAWTDTNYVKKDFTDSAPAATTLASGTKTSSSVIGVDMFGNPVELVTERATGLGKSAGVVTSVHWSHATPAGFSTHNINRNNYAEIALTMLLESRLSVIMGCGHPQYDDNSDMKSDAFNYNYVGGRSTWDSLVYGTSNTFSIASLNGRTEPEDIDGDRLSDPWSLIADSIDFVNLMKSVHPPRRVLGTAKCLTTLNQSRTIADSIPYQKNKNDSVPHLYQMTLAAINVLKENAEGFVLMVEGGAIDWANHANQKHRLIEEQQDFNMMVDSVIAWVENNGGWRENLVIVTGDHETGYLTGPDYDKTNIIDGYDVVDNGKGKMPGMKFNSRNHTNMLVPLYAKGSGSELFHLYADEIDYVFGYYIDNTEVGLLCKDLLRKESMHLPKNVIYMISDGMGYNQLLAANLYNGKNEHAFQKQISGVDFLYTAMSTYPGRTALAMDSNAADQYDAGYNSFMTWIDSTHAMKRSTDSAPAATSMFSGKKTASGAIGVDHTGNELHNIADRAFELGKSTGTVSTVQFSHATPAAFAAHNPNRNNYAEIANEMIIDSKLSVIIGCGAPDFDNDAQPSEPSDYSYVGGESTWDGLNQGSTLFATATIHGNHTVQDINGNEIPDPWTLVRDSIDFVNLASGKTPLRLIGIPKTGTTLNQGRNRSAEPEAYEIPFNQNVPSLSDMTMAALNVLDNNNNGFLLMIEGGAVDWAAHGGQMERVIEEQNAFNDAVEAVMNWVNTNSDWESTLLIITGDHETGFLAGPEFSNSNAIKGYPLSGNGEGRLPSGIFLSNMHTNQLIPLYAHGAGAKEIAAYATHFDYVRGRYINNTEVAQAILKIWKDMPDRSPDINPSEIVTQVREKPSSSGLSADIQIYPNLVQDHINLLLPGPADATVRILNLQGGLMRNYKVNGSAILNLTGIPDGMYIIEAKAGRSTFTTKIIKQE
ncbi:MAG: alkaline phosphatase [Bacteroidales bacterium]|nr:alkaline phosphatase [Bacteroidales bacterium]